MGNDEHLSKFLESFGFSEDELFSVMDELNSYRSIPGTTIGRYMNRVINDLSSQERSAFLKGIMLGIAVRKIDDELSEPDFSNDEKRIDNEIERFRFNI